MTDLLPDPHGDPRLQLQIPDGKWQLLAGWLLLVLGVLLSFGSTGAGGPLLAIGSGLLAWGTGSRWLHHIEQKQVISMHWQIEIMKRQAATCRAALPAVDTPPHP